MLQPELLDLPDPVNDLTPRQGVLVVDDDESLRRWIQQLLNKKGFVAIGAGNVSEGLLAFTSSEVPIALAILDMILPGDAGLDLAAELERQRPGTRILYISGCVGSIAMEAIAHREPESVLLKPFTDVVLIDRVRRLIAKPPAREHQNKVEAKRSA